MTDRWPRSPRERVSLSLHAPAGSVERSSSNERSVPVSPGMRTSLRAVQTAPTSKSMIQSAAAAPGARSAAEAAAQANDHRIREFSSRGGIGSGA
jgi:hypothetical protein